MYSEAYHLKGDPFRLSPDHRFCFRHQSFARNKAYLDYALERGEGFVMITGAPGSGKTTLLNDVLVNADKSRKNIARIVTTQLDANDLLRMVAYSFKLNIHRVDKASILYHLQEFLVKKYRHHQHSLLVIDEAQDLNKAALEEIRLLTNLQIDDKPLLQVFLVGQNNLLELIQDPAMEQLHQRLIASSQLESMKVEETEIYVIHRLRMAGWKHDPLISRGALRRIHLFSRGVPRIINQLCSRLLLYGSVENLHKLDSHDVEEVINELRQEHLIPLTDGQTPGVLFNSDSSSNNISCEEQDKEFPDSTINYDNVDLQKVPEDQNNSARVTNIADLLESNTEKKFSRKNYNEVTLRVKTPKNNLHQQPLRPTNALDQDNPFTPKKTGHLIYPHKKVISARTLQEIKYLFRNKQSGHRLYLALVVFVTTLVFGLVMVIYPNPGGTQLGTLNHQATPNKRVQKGSVTLNQRQTTALITAQHNIQQSLKSNGLDYIHPKNGFFGIRLKVNEQFGWGSAIMSQALQSKISHVARVLRDQPHTIIHIIGYCDPSGSQGRNLLLSQLRAKVVANYLVLRGIPQHRLTTEGRGSKDVINAANPQINRRVELLIETVTPT